MYKNLLSILVLCTIFVVLVGCNRGDDNKSETSKLTEESLKKSPKDSIAYQFELLKAGDAAKLKECFTERQRDRITPEAVEKGKAEASKYTLDDLVNSVEDGEYEGKKTAKIKMKNGRSLTTLIQTEGKWLADTVWFN